MYLKMANIDFGVLTGDDVKKVFSLAKRRESAIPAINVAYSNAINAVLETAAKVNSPVIIQLSYGGATFYAGGSLVKDGVNVNEIASLGAISAAKHVDTLAKKYGVYVILHTDHASKEHLGWVDLLIKASKDYYKKNKKPIYSSHMLDLSKESIKYNISTCKRYLRQLSEIDMFLELELGITGGEEDGVSNENIANSSLYTQPEDVAYAYKELIKISDKFIIAASFGNVHGVYKPKSVKLSPKILKNSQTYIENNFPTKDKKPVDFVFHGGSGSDIKDIKDAISYGVIKMNLDTDIQWAFWDGVRSYTEKYKEYMYSQVGNPESEDKPNKKYYDPRKWLREGERYIVRRLTRSFEDLNCINLNEEL